MAPQPSAPAAFAFFTHCGRAFFPADLSLAGEPQLGRDSVRADLHLRQQTLSSFGQPVDWASNVCAAHRTGQAQAKYWPLMLLRGTPLAKEAYSLGLITSSQLSLNIHDRVGSAIPHVVASPTFTTRDWFAMHDRARAAMEEIRARPLD